MEGKLPYRKHIRALWNGYCDGLYFVTICTKDKCKYFGSIRDNTMRLSLLGEYVKQQIEDIHTHVPEAIVGLYVVMPNHIHFIVSIQPTTYKNITDKLGGFHSYLALVVGGLKASVKRFANKNNIPFAWQFKYYDHIIRNLDEYNRITNYIGMNIINWSDDRYHID